MSILPNYWDRQHFDSPPCRGKLLTSTRNATHYVDHFILKKYWDSIYLTHRHVGWRAGSLGTVRAGAPQISPATEDLSISFREFEWEYFWVFLYFCISVFLWELGLLWFNLQWRIWVFLLEGGGKFTIPHFSNHLFYCCHMWGEGRGGSKVFSISWLKPHIIRLSITLSMYSLCRAASSLPKDNNTSTPKKNDIFRPTNILCTFLTSKTFLISPLDPFIKY